MSLPKGVILNLRENIRTSLRFLINDSLLKKNIENAYFLCEFLSRLDKGHYDHFMALGHIEKSRGNKEEAKRNFEQAMRICKRDKNWNKLKAPSDPPIEEVITSIRKEIAIGPFEFLHVDFGKHITKAHNSIKNIKSKVFEFDDSIKLFVRAKNATVDD